MAVSFNAAGLLNGNGINVSSVVTAILGPEKRLDFPVTKPADRLVNASGDINRAEQQSYKPGGGGALAGEHTWSPNRAIGNLVATWHPHSDCPNDSSSWHTFNRSVQSRHHRYALYRPTGG